MSILRRSGFTAAIALIAAGSGLGAPAANVSLAVLLNQADAVIVATVEAAVASGPDVALSLIVSRVVKGSLGSGSSVPVTWVPVTSSVKVGAGEAAEQTGIWFLKQQGPTWVVLPITVGAVPVNAIYVHVPSGALPVAYAYDAGLPSESRLAYEIAAAAQDPLAATELAHVAASGAVDGLGSDVLPPIWAQLSSSTTPITRAIGLAGQIRLGSAAALVVLSNMDPSAFTSVAQDLLSAGICGYRSSDSAAVGGLGALTKSSYADNVRFCAVHALREIHSKEALAYLAPLLDSASLRSQYEAVAGIASFANGLPIQTAANTATLSDLAVPPDAPLATTDTQKYFPSQSAFARQPQMYISFWKSWLLTHPIN
jgi:hypothetical protein